MKYFIAIVCGVCLCNLANAQMPGRTNFNIKGDYDKLEVMIPMRDGVSLFTAVYVPKDSSTNYPFLIQRTPYACRPYGTENYRPLLGPGSMFANEKYIYVYQDVRGRYMSEGNFEETTPHIPNKKSNRQVDESSDTYDTIEWLLHNIKHNNGKAGIYGISYPGFYATAALANAHPALVAASPQAPVTDEFEGDDVYHRGAFFLMDNYNFLNDFDAPRAGPVKTYPALCEENYADAYTYFLKMGPIKNANEICFKNKSKIWNEYLLHDSNDSYWQARNIRKHLSNVKPAVLVVGGWYDAEDLFGALKTYAAIEEKNKVNNNKLIMGPWTHGGWARGDWSRYGSMRFGSNTSAYFQQMEFDFFKFHLKGSGQFKAAEATMFETGTNEWKHYKTWPPKNTIATNWYPQANGKLALTKTFSTGYDAYVSDPANPVPYINVKRGSRVNEYMVADQKFAGERKDVLTYESTVINKNITLSGAIIANLFVSTTGTDADLIVKLIDVLPDTATDADGKNIGGMQRLVRAEVLRGKFRNSFKKPEAFVPNKITAVSFSLNDVAHTFLAGHKIMVQVQSSWFPLVDRNPQQFMHIATADEKDFKKATVRLFHDAKYPSSIKVMVSQP